MAAKKKKNSITPMMQQYYEVRKSLPSSTLIMFRLGDFYEMFHEDARVGSQILGITLTKRQNYPMAGIPYHAADNYIGKLLAAGKKVAVVDQMEVPTPGKIVKRSLTRILTPGTTLEDHQIDSRRNHYILAVDWNKKGIHAAWLDLTSGEFQITTEKDPFNLLPVFNSIDPREIILPEIDSKEWSTHEDLAAWWEQFEAFTETRPVTDIPDYHFDSSDGAGYVMRTLGVLSLEGFGIQKDHPALGVAGALVFYASENLCAAPQNLDRIQVYSSGHTLLLDPATLKNLEIFRSSANTRDGSLMAAMDGTVTAAGARLLEKVLSRPVLDLETIRRRQNCVGEFLEAPGFASELQDYLRCVRDLERVIGRLQNRIRNPRELGAVRDTLKQIPFIEQILAQFDGDHLHSLNESITDFPDLRDLLESALEDELPNQLQDGDYIRDNFDQQLDHLRSLTRDNKTWIADLEREEQEKTGIRNLRIRFNNAFGYFIEVTKSNLHLVPDSYIRKQTMTNAERYYTPELKEKEKEILSADEKSIAREEELFRDLVAHVLARADDLKKTAAIISEIDLYVGWARLARQWNYSRPNLDNGDTVEIVEGRHPVVEQMMRRERTGLAGTQSFVPNDTHLSSDKEQIAIITGPNMAGKSTYIRQVALIVLMAQTGCWVPAKKCHIGLVDRIFSRVGASDELSRGNSTFMVEMNETANILNNATNRSLIILDEIGRGTSTYDGLSIAWSVVEHLHREKRKGPRTLFATHYHELTQLEKQLDRVRNYCVAVKEWSDEIIFVRQVIKGASDRSYGIQVARLAGLPQSVIDRAKVILHKLEADDSSHNLLRKRMKKIRSAEDQGLSLDQMELDLF